MVKFEQLKKESEKERGLVNLRPPTSANKRKQAQTSANKRKQAQTSANKREQANGTLALALASGRARRDQFNS